MCFDFEVLFRPKKRHSIKTVDGRNLANQLRLVVYPIIYKVLYIPDGFSPDFLHQQYVSNLQTSKGKSWLRKILGKSPRCGILEHLFSLLHQ